MTDAPDQNREKRLAAEAAVAEVRDGMLVGLGTGSTVAFAIAELGRRCREGLTIQAVATSLRTHAAAQQAGITVLDFADLSQIDIGIDGVDEIDAAFRAIKGAGGAMLREKIVARAAGRMLAIADSCKLVERLGRARLPLEVLPFARGFVMAHARSLGAEVVWRQGPTNAPYLTDQGNMVLDCALPEDFDPGDFANRIADVPGVLGHGFFDREIDALYVGRGDQVDRRENIAPVPPGGSPLGR